MNKTIEVMKQHRSIRKFKDKQVSDKTVKTIIEAAQWASTSNFIQAYTVIRVKDKQKRKTIATLAGPQPWVEESPVFLIFCADLKRAQQACQIENKMMETGFTEQFIIATVDVSLLAQNAVIAAESLGLGGVYIGGIRNDPETVSGLLNLPDQVYPLFGLCLGYPADLPEQKPRMPVDMILMDDRYQVFSDQLNQYNDICSSYYESRSSGARMETWTGQISAMMSSKLRPHMKSFLENKGFLQK
jgi:FMN reductase (NADPH)